MDKVLKTGRSIKKSEKYDLILNIAILSKKSNLLFIAFLNSHSMIDTSQV